MDKESLKKLSILDFSNFNGNEQNVKYNIVLPFLNYFGYGNLELEHAAQGSRIDINIGNKIIIETKALNKNLDNYINQVHQYCNNERPNLAILTNGKAYRFYSPFMRVSDFRDTLIYEFDLSDFSNDEILERIYKLIGIENFKNNAYLNYIEERENELKQIRKFIDDYENKRIENINSLNSEISELKSEIIKINSEIELKQQEIAQIKSKKIPEKEELFKKHFIPNKTKSILKSNNKNTKKEVIHFESNEVLHLINSKRDVSASGKFSNGKSFLVFKGSKLSNKVDPKFKESANGAFNLRNDLLKREIVNEGRIFAKNYEFNTISQAASVILGGSRNGKKEWKK